ncbi:head maturation protease, ClpP-related [Leisingera sp. M658]|uniref:head maturation protease, ClpP-related n=1 Tax=Leisingera sp. M658 TaxID=2867015 RepID=UPI0021A8FE70|nr:head maturation protease, ClpP-related [Leisingera sp. M658]UWQ77362.1 Clp protease ClpP [Leisingera sp. M658]
MTKAGMPLAPMNRMPGVRSDLTPQALKNWNPDLAPKAEGLGENSISILNPIGKYYEDGVTAARIAAALRNIGDKPVDVYVNSPGGDVFEGLAIYSLLLEHKANVTVKVLGVAASAASVLAMAADDLLIMRSAFLMIHNTWVVAAGDRNAFQQVAEWLQPFDEALVDIYAARTSIDAKKIGAMLDKETWLGGAKAVEQGFADDFLGADQVSQDVQDGLKISPEAAKKKADLLMARGRAPRSMRRELLAALNAGMPSAAGQDTPSADPEPKAGAQALALLKQHTS